MRVLLVVLFSLAGACSVKPPPRPAASPHFATESAGPALVSLAGEWRIAGIDGNDFNESYGLTLSADDKEIWWAPRCAGLVRSYTLEGSVLRIGQPLGARRRRPDEPNRPVCAIGLPPRIDEVSRAIDSATTARRTRDNGVEISGGGHSLLLFSQ